MSYNHESLEELPVFYLGTFFALQYGKHGILREAMEIILAICITGIGIFGGMLLIWNGQNPIPSKALDTSRTR